MGSKKKSSEKHYKNKEAVKQQVGQSLEDWRVGLGMTREDVASELETTSTSVYRWESGRSPVSMDTLTGLSSVYNTEVQNLFSANQEQIQASLDLINNKQNKDNQNDKDNNQN